MPDFLSRLVERTFGLMPVARPLTGSVFAPMPSRESDYIRGFARDSEPVSNQENNHIESVQEIGIIPQHEDLPVINQKRQISNIPYNQPVPANYIESGSQDNDYAKPLHKIDIPDNQSAFISAPPQQKEPLRQNGSNFPEQAGYVSLYEKSEQDNRYPHKLPANLEQDGGLLYHTNSDTLESVKSEPRYMKNRNDRGTLPQIPKQVLQEEQFHDAEPDSMGPVESGQKDFADIRENRNTLMPMLKEGYDTEQPQIPGISSVEQAESKQSQLSGVQMKRNINRNVLTSEPELHEDLSEGRNAGSKNPNSKHKSPSGQNETFIDIVDSSVNEIFPDHISNSSQLHESLLNLHNSEPASDADSDRPEYLHPVARSSSIIASKQNTKRVNNPNVNATLEQKGNMLFDQHAVTPRPPSTVPTVKVTIGRIEVKAVTPPQAPQVQTPSPRQRTVLSLDDYLKKYNG